MDGKTKAIVAHLWWIGWIIALVLNQSENKDEFASFYIRQLLGLFLLSIVLWFIPIVGWIINLLIFVLWLLSLIGAASGEKKETPVIGKYFQEWFKAL